MQQQALSDHPEVAAPDPGAVPPPARPGARAAGRRARAAAEARRWPAIERSAAGGGKPRRRPGAAAPGGAGRRDPAHQLLPARPRRAAQALHQLQGRQPRAGRPARRPSPTARSSSASPQVEGVHLRLGPVARGGLRWSDRRDDFRTEVLGLVKAQQVKNAVIVPVGSKGGFYPKRLPQGGAPRRGAGRGDRAPTRPSSSACSTSPTTSTPRARWSSPPRRAGPRRRRSLSGGRGRQGHGQLLRHRQRASPSPTASGWATPSPPAARPATTTRPWASPPAAPGRAVKRHFRELGKDIQTRALHRASASATCRATCSATACCCRKQIRLVAAFDHRHVFLDPDPDPATSLGRAQAPVRPAALVLGRLRRGR